MQFRMDACLKLFEFPSRHGSGLVQDKDDVFVPNWDIFRGEEVYEVAIDHLSTTSVMTR